ALSVTFGQALRVTVMVELLAVSTGVGAQVSRARANLMTEDLFAWAILLIAVVLVIELAILRPLTTHLLRWRSTPAETAATGRGATVAAAGVAQRPTTREMWAAKASAK
ncbi:MAG TPA: hypothetical protein PLV68_20555, partial [Ilumatobacteraceae bacterium]|nr:hypothetical protein [Ilumatobacteraceae bacterium]